MWDWLDTVCPSTETRESTILFQLQLSNNHHLADFNVSTHGGEVVSQEDWKYAHWKMQVILKRGRVLALIMTQRHSLLGRSWTIVLAYYTHIGLIQRAKISASALMSHFLSFQSGFARCFHLLQSSPFLLDWRRIIWGTYPFMSRCSSLHFSRRKLSSGHLAICIEKTPLM
jgi:hypothetical protein